MKRIVALMVVLAVSFSVLAGDRCCPSKAKKKDCTKAEKEKCKKDHKCTEKCMHKTGKAEGAVNDICPVMGEKVNPKYTVEHEGQVIGFCCKKCVKAFKKNPKKYMKKLKSREEASVKPINERCPVMGGKVNPKLTLVHDGKTIGFCCEPCFKKFKKNPKKYMKKLEKMEG